MGAVSFLGREGGSSTLLRVQRLSGIRSPDWDGEGHGDGCGRSQLQVTFLSATMNLPLSADVDSNYKGCGLAVLDPQNEQ